MMGQIADYQKQIAQLTEQVATLEKINQSLIKRVEKAIDSSDDAFAVFETNILLQETVNKRTRELEAVNEQLREEIANYEVVERLLKTSLTEKEDLLREIHLRVKEDLQVVTSLLSLQATKVGDYDTLAVLKDSECRVKSMALIHEQLGETENLTSVDFRDYVKNLTSYLLRAFEARLSQISVAVQIDNVHLPVDKAIACGLIVNELFSNCLRHAFTSDRRGVIEISLKRLPSLDYLLAVADNGSGLPREVQDCRDKTLGLELVEMMTEKLGGKLEITTDGGTRVQVTIPRVAVKPCALAETDREATPAPIRQ